MMAVWVNAGALLLIMLTGVTYSYPAKPGFDPSSYSGGYGAYPASAGSPSRVMYAPAASGSGTESKVVTYPASYPSGPYPQPSVQRQPAASSYSSNSYAAAPVASGYASSPSAGSTGPSPAQPNFSQDVSWAMAPPSPLSGNGASAGPSGAYPASAGSPSRVMYAPAASRSGTASKGVAYPASYPSGEPSYPQPSVQRQPAASSYSSSSYAASPVASGYASSSSAPSYPQPSVPRQPAASSYSSNSYAAAPVAPEYASGSSAGSTGPSPGQPTFSRDVDWAVAPPSPLSGDGASARPSAGQFSGPSNVSPPRPPQFQGGELNKYAQIAEYGNSESETEEQGFLPAPPPPGAQALSREEAPREDSPRDIQPSGPGSSLTNSFYPYPYDYLFLTGQYPPGTVTHASSSFEQGADSYQDTHYIRYYYPASPSVEQVKMSPPAFEVPQSVQQPRQPVRQSAGSAGYYPSGAATGYNRPYRAAGGYGAYKGDQ